MKIFLIGFMGCGKTTLGRKLASRLSYDFIDLDQVLETQEGITIAQYFATYGEERFRTKESEVLKSVITGDDQVISTGGGLPCFFDNINWMKANGKVVYINLPPAALASRLENAKEERPLLQGKHGNELVKFIAEKLAEREPFYLQANIVADGLSLTAERLQSIIFKQ
ncbi:shikimate kinase [Mucilaginibacter ginkgonis]|uniref:Shikimate kinase n=1 Tax=Mucilaginibacter ginkgonis TaxID=2682091 RepID=A0A6I4HXR5_9SPHI|nr:shikimate kinase [Mucilaginibacter ginkgonis]QQL49297.1 AAA family ATPase [Mucilaginibacter ginkgonis]